MLAKILWLLLAFTAISLPAYPAGFGDSLGLSPFWDWRTIETENFRLTYPAEVEDLAKLAAKHFEDAHRVLSRELRWQPATKTQVLLVDNTDAANGLATPIGRFGIVLYLTPPENWFSTAYNDDWFRLLIFHEYTHLLNMDPTRGIWSVTRPLFGDLLLPNSTWPSWMLEGLAVYMETRHTRAGRGRSTYWDAILRAQVEAGSFDTDRAVTLDRLNGESPGFPDGEIPYLYGYQMMNHLARKHGNEAISEMTERSSYRIPYLNNGNLENITGGWNWYDFWEEWVEETRVRIKAQLAKLETAPRTPHEIIDDQVIDLRGVAASPDGKHIAYIADHRDRRAGLFLREIASGKIARVVDAVLGADMSFTPDSKQLVFSSAQRHSNYYLWSDLRALDLETGKIRSLTEGLRARAPSVSPDGKQIAYTRAEKGTVGLEVADLGEDGRLGPGRKLYWPDPLSTVSSPRFSPDGTHLVFTLHRNGRAQEDLYEADLLTWHARPLLSDGKFNRFPSYDTHGVLHFISNATGVDNLYRLPAGAQKPERVTHVTTGLSFASAGPLGWVGAWLTDQGWKLAEFETSVTALPTEALTIAPPPALTGPEPTTEPVVTEPQPYSIFPSIWPRQWLPAVTFSSQGFYLGASVLGFDATDRHRYILGAAYDTQTRQADAVGIYENRMLGATWSTTAFVRTTGVASSGSQLLFTRERSLRTSLSFPFQWTLSSITPQIGLNLSREYLYDSTQGTDEATEVSRYVPSVDASATYTDAQSSRFAVGLERGRTIGAGVRAYIDSGQQSFKGLLLHHEYIPLGSNAVFTPSVKLAFTSRFVSGFADANVLVRGRQASILGSFFSDNLSQLSLRGYPQMTFIARGAGIGALDFKAPIFQIFRGGGTDPVFLRNLYGVAFVEGASFPTQAGSSVTLPSAGFGLRSQTDWFYRVPVSLALEYHRGFRADFGGTGEVFLDIGTSISLY